MLRYEPPLLSRVRGFMRRVKPERAGDWAFGDEPRPDGEDWVEYGGVLMWVAGFTEGGVPYGLGVEEFRLANERDARDAGWARAKSVLRDLLELSSDPLTLSPLTNYSERKRTLHAPPTPARTRNDPHP